jgi:hypothetical protein
MENEEAKPFLERGVAMSTEPAPTRAENPYDLDFALRPVAPGELAEQGKACCGVLALNLARRIIVAVYVPLAIAAAVCWISFPYNIRYNPFPGIDEMWNTWHAWEHPWVWVVAFHLAAIFEWFWWRPAWNRKEA